jgi:ABC-type dipeptide/oligopeptide/nickel transport system permease component
MMINLALQLPNIPAPILLAVLPALLAGIIGFILGELRARLDTRRSDKAILKVVLFTH